MCDSHNNFVPLGVLPGPSLAVDTAQARQQSDSAQAPFEVSSTGGRPKLWHLPRNLHCPVIGTCFEVAQLRRLASNAGCPSYGELDDYQVHVSFVAAAEEKNALSLATHKALEKKFGAQVRRFRPAKNTEQLNALWDEHLARGEVAGAFWALLTHPRCDAALRQSVYEQVHMLSHQIGAGQRADLRQLATTELQLRELRHEFDRLYQRSHSQLEEREAQIHQLQQQLRNSQLELIKSRDRAQVLQTQNESQQRTLQQSRLPQLQEQLRQTQKRLQDTQFELQSTQELEHLGRAENAELRDQLEQKASECRILEGLFRDLSPDCDGCATEQCGSCPNLQGRCVLCVGGRNQLLSHYRSVVRQCNGRFEHHDGGQEDNRSRLDAMLAAADVVVCQTDCVSHDAYYRLKKACKRQGKRHLFLESSGVSSFARAIHQVALE